MVADSQRELIDQMESDSIEFLAPERSLLPQIDLVRQRIATEVNSRVDDLVFTSGTTDAVNVVARSIAIQLGDQWLITSHAYNACRNALKHHAKRAGAKLVAVDTPTIARGPEDIIDRAESKLSPRTRFKLIDQVSSAIATVYSVNDLVNIARREMSPL